MHGLVTGSVLAESTLAETSSTNGSLRESSTNGSSLRESSTRKATRRGIAWIRSSSPPDRLNAQVDVVMAAAVASEPAMTALFEELTLQSGGRLAGLEHRLKTRESLIGKGHRTIVELARQALEAREPLVIDAATVVWAITDALRYTMVVPLERYTSAVSKVRSQLSDAGLRTVKLRNYWAPDTYKGINDVFAVDAASSPNGSLHVELQFHTAESFACKMGMHALYEDFRSTLDPVAKLAVQRQLHELVQSVPDPPGGLGDANPKP